MSNFTNYLIQAQDLDVTGASLFNAFERRTYKDFKICWPTLKDISTISKYKIKEPDEANGIKGDTSSLRKKIKQLEKAGHIKRLGVLCVEKKKISAMYWVNYGSNDVVADIKAFINEMKTHPNDHRLIDEKIAVLNKYLSENTQPVDNSIYTGSEKPSQTGSEKPSALGLRNPVEIKGKEKQKLELGADAPFTSIFKQLEPEDRIKASRIKAKPYLYDLLAELVLATPEFDNRNFAIRGEIAAIIRTLKELDAETGMLDAKFIIERYKADLAIHMEFTKLSKFSQFKTMIAWLKDFGWTTDRYRMKPVSKSDTKHRYDVNDEAYQRQKAETEEALKQAELNADKKLQKLQELQKKSRTEKDVTPKSTGHSKPVGDCLKDVLSELKGRGTKTVEHVTS